MDGWMDLVKTDVLIMSELVLALILHPTSLTGLRGPQTILSSP